MIKDTFLIVMAVISYGIEVASAQPVEQRLHQATEMWTIQTGDYVPHAVRREVFQRITVQIADTAYNQVSPTILGLNNPYNYDAAHAAVAEVLDERIKTFGQGPVVALGPPPRQAQAPQEYKYQAIVLVEKVTGTLTTVQSVGLWLQAYPTIRVIVQPKPPKEFLLTINGEPCPATEKATYRVPAGTVTIRVWRQGSAPCEKTYATTAGNVYDVECAF